MNLNRMLRGTAMATGALALAGLVGLTALNQGAQAQEDGNITCSHSKTSSIRR